MFATRKLAAHACSTFVTALLFLGAFLPAANGQTIQPVTSAGATSGQFDVSSNGQATYTIPLWTPPGINGIQPNLALTYNSQDRGGLISPGWSLAGFSQITRCQKTWDQDGTAAPVYLAMSDMFCMGGNRLRVTSGSSTQGQPDSTYQTEIADFSLVRAMGTAGNGPAWFEVKLKNGLIYEYGNSTDSRAQLPGGSTPYAWALTKIRDRRGNNLTVTYAQSSGTVAPLAINYTQAPSVDATYPYTVVMNWTPRGPSDTTAGYIAGSQYTLDSQLTSVEVKYGGTSGTLLRRYSLFYSNSPTTQKARLAYVQECAGSNGADCKLTTAISYQDGQAGVAAPSIDVIPVQDHNVWRLADFNGDGRTDILYRQDTGTGVRYVIRMAATGGGYSSTIYDMGFVGVNDDVLIDDFDGSGAVDLLMPINGFWVLHRWGGLFMASVSTGLPVDANRLLAPNPLDGRFPSFASADVNGDGLPDMVWAATYDGVASIYTRLNTASGAEGTVSFSATMTLAYPILSYPYRFAGIFGNYSSSNRDGRRVDFNGDGRDDAIVGYWRGDTLLISGSANQLISQGQTFATGVQLPTWIRYPDVINFNNDACTDMFHEGGLLVSACNGSTGHDVTGLSGSAQADWDGDGRTDLLGVIDNRWHVRLSQSTTLGPAIDTNIASVANTVWLALDADGDGLDDVMELNYSARTVRIGLHNDADVVPDLATSISDGYGNRFQPVYRSIASLSVHNWGEEIPYLGFPNPYFGGPMQAVTEVMVTNGNNLSYTNSYYYTNARTNLQGRGFLGFETITMSDSRNGQRRVRTYKQHFPLTGRLVSEVVSDAFTRSAIGGFTWEPRTLDNTPYNNRVFVQMTSAGTWISESTGALRGTQVSSSRTVNTFDAWGTLTRRENTVEELGTGLSTGSTHREILTLDNVVNDTDNWCLSKPGRVQHTASHTLAGGAALTRTSNLTWDYANCRPTHVVAEPGSVQWEVTTAYGFDAVGNISSVVETPVSGQGQSARTTLINWGTSGRFPTEITNPSSQVTTFDWDMVNAVRTSVTDPNDLTTQSRYDSFNRPTRVQNPDGTAVEYAWLLCLPSTTWCGNSAQRSGVRTTLRDTSNSVLRTNLTYFNSRNRSAPGNFHSETDGHADPVVI